MVIESPATERRWKVEYSDGEVVVPIGVEELGVYESKK